MQPHRGRPRDDRIERSVIAAAVEVFGERGYPDASLLEIARRAKVGTPTLYRRWRTKAALAVDLLGRLAELPAPDTGDIRADLRSWLRSRVKLFGDPLFAHLLLTVSAVGVVDPAVGERVQAVWTAAAEPMLGRLLEAQTRGELPRQVDVALVFDAAVGSIIVAMLRSGRPRTQDDLEALVASLLGTPARP